MKRKSTLVFILVVSLIGGFFVFRQWWGSRAGFIGDLFSTESSVLREMSLKFMEDIRFKDFERAASYHSPGAQLKADIPRLIEKMFKIKPELLDVMEYKVLDVSFNTDKTRARVKLKVKVNILNSGQIKNPEIILYFMKEQDKWYMDLESSLKTGGVPIMNPM